MRNISILGATGSIGVSTLDVVARHPKQFNVVALSCHRNTELLAQQCRRFEPQYAVVADESAAEQLQQLLGGLAIDIRVGEQALITIASLPQADIVMAAIVGAAGMPAALAAATAGKCLLLANKEALVLGGALFMQAVKQGGGRLLPIDSEHNAIYQCLPSADVGRRLPGVSKLLLTASGGPFRCRELGTFADIEVAEAVAHPNWAMGQKISVDSATMMNKGLELIEARWLFDMPAEDIQVVIHPESVIHSLVQYVDGSVLAQLGNPDMRTPIAHALACCVDGGERIAAGVEPLDLFAVASMRFEPPDMARFPCLQLAYDALAADELACAVLNAANEVTVSAFLSGKIRFTDIASLNTDLLQQHGGNHYDSELSWELLQQVDQQTRRDTETAVAALQ